MEKFRNQYRIASARLNSWDYGSDGFYFITICTAGRNHFFGEVQNGEMTLSGLGVLAERYWMEIPVHFPFVTLGNFVVMPNHVHGILMIDKHPIDAMGGGGVIVETPNLGVLELPHETAIETPKLGVSTGNPTTNPPGRRRTTAASEKWRPATLGVIINQYKRMVTIECRKKNPAYAWQSRFYDHIIRDVRSYENIHEYILTNPARWKKDKFFADSFS